MSDALPLPWTLRSADVEAAGLTRGELVGTRFTHLRRGVWAAPGVDASDADVRIAAVVAGMPEHGCLGGWSAARLFERVAARDGLEVFDGGAAWDDGRAAGARRATGAHSTDQARVVLCVHRDSRLELRPDVRVFRTPVGSDHRVSVAGVRVTSGDRTAFDLARLLPTVQAVVGLDRLLHLAVASLDGVAQVAAASPRWRGATAARRSLHLADPAAESPQESLLRLVWCACGLPRPGCNKVVRDRDGRFVARVDLIDPDAGVVGEYDGSWHAGARRRSDDARRQEELEGLGLVVLRATAVDVRPDGVDAWGRRLRAGYLRAARRRPSDRGWTVTDS